MPCPSSTHIVVDWSAAVFGRAPGKPTKDAIWWAVARIYGGEIVVASPEYARTRQEALDRLARLIAGELHAGRQVLVGFDFPFGYPAGVAERLTGKASALALWDWLAERIEDGPDNDNNRYAVAAAINAAYPGIGPFWGRPTKWSYPTIPVRASARSRQEVPTARAPHRRPSRKGRQDRLAAGLCRLRRLADAAGPACPQAPCDRPAPRWPRGDLALRDRLASARRAGGDRRGLPLASQE